MADGFVKVNAPDSAPAGEPWRVENGKVMGGVPPESGEERQERARGTLAILKDELAQAKTDDEAKALGREMTTATQIAEVPPQNRGSRITAELKGDWKKVNTETAATATAAANEGWVDINKETKKADPKTERGEFMKGFVGGMVSANPKMLGSAAKGIGTMTGWDWLKGQGERLAALGEENAKDYQPKVGSVANVRTDSVTNTLGDFFTKYLPYQTGNALASMAPTIAAGLVGAGAGSAVAGPPGAAAGSMAGIVLTGYPMNYGDIYSDALDDKGIKQAVKDGKLTDEDVAKITALAAVPITALDSWSMGKLGAALTKDIKAGLYKRIFSEMAAGGLREGTTEGLQQILSEAVQHSIGSDKTMKEHAIAVVDNAIGGLMGGVVTGGAAGVVQGAKSAPAAAQPAAEPAPQGPAAPPNLPAPQAEAQGPDFATQFMAKPPRELTALEQARVDGNALKENGSLPVDVLRDTARFENAKLIAVYGENTAVHKVIEHPELTGSLKEAMLAAAPTVEQVRSKLKVGEQSRDITPDILSAVYELAAIRAQGKTVAQVMAHGVEHEASYEAQQLMQFLDQNLDNPQELARFMEHYLHTVEAMGGVPSEVRGRAFDIVQERHSAREQQKAEEGRLLLERMEKQKSEEDAYAKRAHEATKREFELKRLKDEDTKRTRKMVATERAEKIASELRAKARAAKPEEKTALSLAMEKAKGSNREKPRSVATPVPAGKAKDHPAGAGPTSGPRGADQLSVAAQARDAGKQEPVRASGAEKSPAALPAHAEDGTVNRGSAIAADLAKPVDKAAHEAATSPKNDLPAPSEPQIEAGNYKKGHANVGGLDVSVENPSGSKRRPEWPTLASHYGYVKGVPARSPDKEHVDVFVKPGTAEDYNGPVFVIDQNKEDGSFDESKSMVGFATEKEARAAYLKNYTAGFESRIRGITELTLGQFKAKLQDAEAFMKPQAVEAPAETPVTLTAADIPSDLKITLPVLVEDVGETVMVERNARQAFKEASRRVNRLESMRNCLRS